MAVVSRAVIEGPLGFSRALCIKRIRPALSGDPAFVRKLAAEARLSALLLHPNIVQVHDFGDVDGEYYIAMELVEGMDLLAVLRRASNNGITLPIGVICHVVAEVARALGYAHALTDEDSRPLGIIHRDVTPSNIMITPLGAVKLLDFGIARATAHLRNDIITRSGALHGKVSYLSPEQVIGEPATPRSDLFSLGVVFHELLTLHKLFSGRNDLQVMQSIYDCNVPPPSLSRQLPPDVDEVVLRLLQRNPAERFASGEELASALLPIARRLHGDAVTLQKLYVRLEDAPRAWTELEDEPTPLVTHH
jgi:serine/threonine-protein kinase